MRLTGWGRCAPFLIAVVLVAALLARADPAVAACDVGFDCSRLFGPSATGFEPAGTSYSGYYLQTGAEFTVSTSATLHEVAWHRCTTGATRPIGFTIWDNGANMNVWAGTGASYTDVTDNAAVGWQVTNLSGSNRITLEPGHSYVIAINIGFTGVVCADPAFSPVPVGPLNYVQGRYGTTNWGYPNGTTTDYQSLDVGIQSAPAATVTPLPTNTPAPTTTGTPTAIPATVTPVPPAPAATQVDTRPQLAAISTAITQEGNDQAAAISAAGAAQGTAIAEAGAAQATSIAELGQSATADSAGVQAALDAIGSTMGAWGEQIAGTIGALGASIGDRIGGAQEAASSAQSTAVAGSANVQATAIAGAASAQATSAAESASVQATAVAQGASVQATAIAEASSAGASASSGIADAIGDLGGGIQNIANAVQDRVQETSDAIANGTAAVVTAIGQIPGIPGDINDGVVGALNGLAAGIWDGLSGALVPSPGFIEGRAEGVRTAVEARLPIGDQLQGIEGELTEFLEGAPACLGSGFVVGVSAFGVSGSVAVISPEFLSWWCPLRPILGAVTVLFSGWAAARALVAMLELHR